MTATAKDNVGVVRVEFIQNGVVVNTFKAAPYQATIRLVTGVNRINACAYDAAGKKGCGLEIVVTR